MIDPNVAEELENLLASITFPTNRGAILAHAQQSQISSQLMRELEFLPNDHTFQTVEDVYAAFEEANS